MEIYAAHIPQSLMLAGHTVLGGSLPTEWTDLNLLSRLEVGARGYNTYYAYRNK
jgi:hypothetical protein